jgi:hypothetical protein
LIKFCFTSKGQQAAAVFPIVNRMDLCESLFDSTEKFSVYQMRESLEALTNMEEENELSLKRVKQLIGLFGLRWLKFFD